MDIRSRPEVKVLPGLWKKPRLWHLISPPSGGAIFQCRGLRRTEEKHAVAHAGKILSGTATALRRKAEARLHITKRDVSAMPIMDVQWLVYELQVHQIELELQNEELLRAQMELQAARDRYQDLYESARPQTRRDLVRAVETRTRHQGCRRSSQENPHPSGEPLVST
jgi:hypothetical protein